MSGMEIAILMLAVFTGVIALCVLCVSAKIGARLHEAERNIRRLSSDGEYAKSDIRSQGSAIGDVQRDAKLLRDYLGVERCDVKAEARIVAKAPSSCCGTIRAK